MSEEVLLKKYDKQICSFEFLRKFSCLLLIGVMLLLLHRKTKIRYLTLPFIVQMGHFDTFSMHPAVQTIDTMSICIKKFVVEKIFVLMKWQQC